MNKTLSEQMYKEYGVEPKPTKCQGLYNCEECENAKKINCYKEFEYPKFTAEKQLEVIKLILKTNALNIHKYEQDYKINTIDYLGKELPIFIKNQDFSQALAQLTAELIKANELDKQEVKRILER